MNAREFISDAATLLAIWLTLYFTLWNGSQFVMAIISGLQLRSYHKRRTPRNLRLTAKLQQTPLISIIAPAYNESLTIIESVEALLAVDYEQREVVVVNDGSTDNTLAVLIEHFRLEKAPVAFETPIKTEPIIDVYRSAAEPHLVVVNKVNGGCKADASNAGINAASGQLILIVDADTMLEPDALRRSAAKLLEDPRMVAVGGYVALANGCQIQNGRVVSVALPRSWLARMQILEYMRTFLLFRIACAAGNGVAVISGAFGLFRRKAVIAVGGYDTETVGEDMELTFKLHQYYREQGRPYLIGHVPVPVCWTQVPEDLASLKTQRCRWRRGLIEVLWMYRSMILNPRYGVLGLVVLPYIIVFEALAPLVQVGGLPIVTLAFLMQVTGWEQYRALLMASLLFGTATGLVAVALNDLSTGRYLSPREFLVLMGAALLEGIGYRQINSWWSCVGTWEVLSGKKGWGTLTRKAFEA